MTESPPGDTHFGRVAVVDPSPAHLAATADLLDALGFSALSFPDPADLLALPELDGIDAVLCEMRLASMTGLGLMRALRQRGRALPVLIMTGAPDEATRRQTLARGAAAYLPKPLDPETLLASLRVLMR